MYKNLVYSLSCLAFAVVIGGAIYEHMTVVPAWTAAPPKSLSMFQGEYGLKPEPFWKIIHPINLILFTISLVLHWRSARKKNILIVFSSYFAILVITAIYFVPELLAITGTPFSVTVDAGLAQRAKTWETLSLIRLGGLIVLSLFLFNGLTKASISARGRGIISQAAAA
jgi:hypothetical protein